VKQDIRRLAIISFLEGAGLCESQDSEERRVLSQEEIVEKIDQLHDAPHYIPETGDHDH
jgi:hypothetical protein